MVHQGFSVEKGQGTITALELKQLLVLLSKSLNVCFRFRLVGEMWTKNHVRVSTVNDRSVLLHEESSGKYQLVSLNSIMQFDIDQRFQNYQPHFHYGVTPSPELE